MTNISSSSNRKSRAMALAQLQLLVNLTLHVRAEMADNEQKALKKLAEKYLSK